MIHYYSVDVETTSTNPFTGDLLSIGIQVVYEDGSFGPNWYRRTIPRSGIVVWGDSAEWWADQEEDAPLAWSEIFNPNSERTPEPQAAEELVDFMIETGTFKLDARERVFVAHPASFDYPWIQRFLTRSDLNNTGDIFSYRTLDLRSAGWALDPDESMANSVRTHKSDIPHHALHDAIAQAHDLARLLSKRRRLFTMRVASPADEVPA